MSLVITGSPQAEDFLRKLSAISARVHKKVRQPFSGPKNIDSKGRQNISLLGAPTCLRQALTAFTVLSQPT